MSICEQCGKEHDGTFGSGRFCCRSCSNKWVALHQSEEAKARKVVKGSKNLRPAGDSSLFKRWYDNLSSEEKLEHNMKSARARSENIRKRKKSILEESLITGVYPEDYKTNTVHFKYDLVDLGYKEWVCDECGIGDVWNGKPLMLQLHHEDGDRNNCKLSNLKFLCPNCHSQTDTFSFRNMRKKLDIGD